MGVQYFFSLFLPVLLADHRIQNNLFIIYTWLVCHLGFREKSELLIKITSRLLYLLNH